MWWNTQLYKATVTVFVIVTVQNVQSQNQAECTAYLNGTDPDPQFAAVLKVQSGTRMKFVYKDTNENNICNYQDSYAGWRKGSDKIIPRNIDQAPEYISVNMSDDVCVYEMHITFSNNMTQLNVIHFEQILDECCTYEICSGNVTAKYIIVIVEDENPEQTTLFTTTPPTAPPYTSPSTSPLEICPQCSTTILASAVEGLGSNLTFKMESECKKFYTKWQYTLLGVELLSLVVAFFTGIISTAICCKLQPKQPMNQPTTQFLNPTYQGGAMDTNSNAQSDNLLTQNINQEITNSHSSLTTDSH